MSGPEIASIRLMPAISIVFQKILNYLEGIYLFTIGMLPGFLKSLRMPSFFGMIFSGCSAAAILCELARSV